MKKTMNDIGSDLLALINAAGKESKGQITKLTERTRSLERDIEMYKS